jgi:hypothetical protein
MPPSLFTLISISLRFIQVVTTTWLIITISIPLIWPTTFIISASTVDIGTPQPTASIPVGKPPHKQEKEMILASAKIQSPEVRSLLMTQGLRFLHHSLILRLATLKREDSKPSGIGGEKPISSPLCAESDVFDDLQNSTAGTKAPKIKEIDDLSEFVLALFNCSIVLFWLRWICPVLGF